MTRPDYGEPARELRRRLAYHEAGHALACVDQGLDPPTHCSVLAESGRTAGIRWDPRYGAELEGYIVTALAGGIAQRLAGDPHALDCSASDLRRALAAAGSMAALQDAELHAERVVVRLWPAIERLATTLLRRDRLVGAELAAGDRRRDGLDAGSPRPSSRVPAPGRAAARALRAGDRAA